MAEKGKGKASTKATKPKGATTHIPVKNKSSKVTSIGKSKFSRLSKSKSNWKIGKKKSRGQG